MNRTADSQGGSPLQRLSSCFGCKSCRGTVSGLAPVVLRRMGRKMRLWRGWKIVSLSVLFTLILFDRIEDTIVVLKR